MLQHVIQLSTGRRLHDENLSPAASGYVTKGKVEIKGKIDGEALNSLSTD